MALQTASFQRAPDGQACTWSYDIDAQGRITAVVCDNQSSYTGGGRIIDEATSAVIFPQAGDANARTGSDGLPWFVFPPNSTRAGAVQTVTVPNNLRKQYWDSANQTLIGISATFRMPI